MAGLESSISSLLVITALLCHPWQMQFCGLAFFDKTQYSCPLVSWGINSKICPHLPTPDARGPYESDIVCRSFQVSTAFIIHICPPDKVKKLSYSYQGLHVGSASSLTETSAILPTPVLQEKFLPLYQKFSYKQEPISLLSIEKLLGKNNSNSLSFFSLIHPTLASAFLNLLKLLLSRSPMVLLPNAVTTPMAKDHVCALNLLDFSNILTHI